MTSDLEFPLRINCQYSERFRFWGFQSSRFQGGCSTYDGLRSKPAQRRFMSDAWLVEGSVVVMCFLPSVTRARNRDSHLAVTCSFSCDRRALGGPRIYIDWSHTWDRSSEASSLGLCLLLSRSIWKTAIYLLQVGLLDPSGALETMS